MCMRSCTLGMILGRYRSSKCFALFGCVKMVYGNVVNGHSRVSIGEYHALR